MPSSIYFFSAFCLALFLHSLCWLGTDAFREGCCLISKILGTARVQKYCSKPQTRASWIITCAGIIDLWRKDRQFCCPTSWEWGKCNMGWCCSGGSFPEELAWCLQRSVKPGEHQVNQVRILKGKPTNQEQESFHNVFVDNPFYAISREDCHSCRVCTPQPTDALNWKSKSEGWNPHWSGI